MAGYRYHHQNIVIRLSGGFELITDQEEHAVRREG